jgi:hypothetical protein
LVGTSILGLALVAALGLNNALTADTKEAPDRLVLRSKSSFSLKELTVLLGTEGSLAELRICESLDRFGSCKVQWRAATRVLAKGELDALARMARQAQLFGGRSDGAQMDFAYRSLEVSARRHYLAVLITSLNESFSEDGPRKELLKRLIDIEAGLMPSLKPVVVRPATAHSS